MNTRVNEIYNQVEEWSLRDIQRLISELESLEDALIEKISNDE